MIQWLQEDPWGFLQFMLYRAPGVMMAIVIHEYAHGYAAFRCGDNTAKSMGRLSLNPLKHLDPLGTVALFLLGFGWAKPVPVNPGNFKRGKRDDLIVSLAGVTVNFGAFLLTTVLTILVGRFLYNPDFIEYAGIKSMLGFNQRGFVLQLYPQFAGDIAPLLARPWLLNVQRLLLHFCMMNLGLALFNLLPIPPLDGFHVLNDTLLNGRIVMGGRTFRIMQAVLIVIMLSTDVVGRFIDGAIYWVQELVLSGMLFVLGS